MLKLLKVADMPIPQAWMLVLTCLMADIAYSHATHRELYSERSSQPLCLLLLIYVRANPFSISLSQNKIAKAAQPITVTNVKEQKDGHHMFISCFPTFPSPAFHSVCDTPCLCVPPTPWSLL
jgi:hypothetical protein